MKEPQKSDNVSSDFHVAKFCISLIKSYDKANIVSAITQ